VFRQPRHHELPLMDAFASRTTSATSRPAGGRADGDGDGYAQASADHCINLPRRAGSRQRHGHVYDAQMAGSHHPGDGGQQDTEYLVQEPILSGDLATLAKPFVKFSAQVRTPQGPSHFGASCGQNGAGAADRAGVLGAAGDILKTTATSTCCSRPASRRAPAATSTRSMPPPTCWSRRTSGHHRGDAVAAEPATRSSRRWRN